MGKKEFISADEKESIKRHIASDPQAFYEQFKGPCNAISTKELRWGTKGSFCVQRQGHFAGCFRDYETSQGGDMIEFVRRERFAKDGKGGFKKALLYCRDYVARHPTQLLLPSPPVAVPPSMNQREVAAQLWESSQSILGSLGEHYLRQHRAITDASVIEGFRFHPAFPCDGLHSPALLARLVDPLDRMLAVYAVQGVILSTIDGNKAISVTNQKLTRGEYAGHFVPVRAHCSDANAALVAFGATVALAEGPETAASVAAAAPELAVWAALGKSNMHRFPLAAPRGARLLLCQDNDHGDKNDEAANAPIIASLFQAGYAEIRVARPRQQKTDFNDVLRSTPDGVKQVRALLSSATAAAARPVPTKKRKDL